MKQGGFGRAVVRVHRVDDGVRELRSAALVAPAIAS